ncbi:hypothetical protein [Oryza sativa Japonica Group]|uniref:Uncharacterized protein OJ1123_G09.19 n=1 Tax=Oryza sativa subsp. japonica TaxID=39947 RepID=Q8LH49_ORYSJ|nr:hypothetical protein [Oryza sativa Japonica Group]
MGISGYVAAFMEEKRPRIEDEAEAPAHAQLRRLRRPRVPVCPRRRTRSSVAANGRASLRRVHHLRSVGPAHPRVSADSHYSILRRAPAIGGAGLLNLCLRRPAPGEGGNKVFAKRFA